MSDLNAILAEDVPQQEEVTEEAEQVEEAQPVAEQAEEATGEESAPPAPKQDEEEGRRKGIEAAMLAERQRRQAAEARLRELESRIPQPKPMDRPQRSQYADETAYEDALLAYGAEQAQLHFKAQQAEQEKQRQAQDFAELAEKTVATGKSKYTDFDSVINVGLAPFLTPELHQALILGGGADVAYWLGKNPGEAARIAQMQPLQMAVEIGALKGKVSAPPKPRIPQTLTQERNAQGRFTQAYSGPTPLDEIVAPARR